MAEHIIWNEDINLNDWKDYIKEEIVDIDYPDYDGNIDAFIDEHYNECYDRVYELNGIYLDDERLNLDIKTEGRIICIADLGLWNGRRMGYKYIGNNISACLYSSMRGDSMCKWYVETRGRGADLKCREAHHDGTNYYTYRELKPNLSDSQIRMFEDKLYYGTATAADISRYTRGIGHYINDVYGFFKKKGAA